MMNVEFQVIGKPPYKQTPADSSERANQRSYRDNLVMEAKKHFTEFSNDRLKIEVVYTRNRGMADSMNIIGGIADSLEGIAYENDKQLVEVHYVEKTGLRDEYTIKLSSV